MTLKPQSTSSIFYFVGHTIYPSFHTNQLSKNISHLLIENEQKVIIRSPRKDSAMKNKSKIGILTGQLISSHDEASSPHTLTISIIFYLIELMYLGYDARDIFKVFRKATKARPALIVTLNALSSLTHRAHTLMLS